MIPTNAPFLATFDGRTDAEDPLKVFRFQVEVDNFSRFGFTKCSGLTVSVEEVKYREGGSNTTPQKSPGLADFPSITLERGQILATGAGGDDFIVWFTQVFDASAKTARSSKTFRKDIDIVQFDKEGNEARRWRLDEAWPSALTGAPDLDALSSENAIEKLVIAHEGFKLIPSP
jgi:phage tail-like protein